MDERDAIAATVERIQANARRAERLKWAYYCDGMVEMIDRGLQPNASARAAFASLAKSMREKE